MAALLDAMHRGKANDLSLYLKLTPLRLFRRPFEIHHTVWIEVVAFQILIDTVDEQERYLL